MRAAVTLALLALAGVLLGVTEGAAAPAQAPKLFGQVGPEFTIDLRDAQGTRVTKLDPGTYVVEVEDLSDFHSFHLSGPGVDERTDVTFTGTVEWTVTFRDGKYTYACDPHPSLAGEFTVSNRAPAPAPSPSGTQAITAKTRVVLTAGPRPVITLKTAAGKSVKAMKVGTYRVTVRDRSRAHNVHVRAPGFNRKTTLGFVGTQRWRVRLTRPGTFRFLCDPHASLGMRGSVRIVR
jgi:plastocyanin